MKATILCAWVLLTSISFADETADPRQLRADHAPTPFSAAEIAACCAHGRTTVFEIVTPQGKVRQKTRFLLPDETGVEVEVENLHPRTGRTMGQPSGARALWANLQMHASFPKSITTIGTGKVATPAGAFDCHVYTVATPTGKRVFYFAKKLPGPPVKIVATDTNGKDVMTMTLLAHQPFDYPTYFGDQSWKGRTVREDVAFAASAAVVRRRGADRRSVVVASLRVTDGAPVRHAALRITKGTLKGAVIRLTDEKPSTQGRMIVSREYELPKRWHHASGALEFEVVDLR